MVHINKWAILPSMAVVGMIGVGIYEIFGPSSLYLSNTPQLALFSDLTIPTEIVTLVEPRTLETQQEESSVATVETTEEEVKEAEEVRTPVLQTEEQPTEEEVVSAQETVEETPQIVVTETTEEPKTEVTQPPSEPQEETTNSKLEVKKDPEVSKTDNPPAAAPGSKPKIESEIEEDGDFVKGLWGDSIGWKYRQYVILAKVEDKIWEQKATKINDLLKTQKITANGWDDIEQGTTLTAKEVATKCRKALEKLDWASLLTGRRKDFWDVTWDFCGKPGKVKPHNWWWP